MRLCTIALLLALALPSVPVRAEWRWLNPRPQGCDLNAIGFLDPSTAIAVGAGGTICVSHDGGLTWDAKNNVNGIHETLAAVAGVNSSIAVTASDGLVLRTIDGGTTWTTIAAPFGNVSDVDFFGTTGFIASSTGLYRSTDAGVSWSRVHELPTQSVSVPGIATAFAASKNQLLVSSDAGATWTQLALPSWPSISFIDDRNGLCWSSYNIWQTGDGGSTWVPVPGAGVHRWYDLALVDTQTILGTAVLSSRDPLTRTDIPTYVLLHSPDGGTSWRKRESPRRLDAIAHDGASAALAAGMGGAIHRYVAPDVWLQTAGAIYPHLAGGASTFADRNHGVVIGSDDMRTVLLRTADGGDTWQPTVLDSVTISGVRTSVRINDIAYGRGVESMYAVGKRVVLGPRPWNEVIYNAISRSDDGGATWRAIWSSTEEGEPMAVAFATPRHGVAVGTAGLFAVIDNDRVTTGRLPEDLVFHWWDVAFADHRVAVAVGGYRFADEGFIVARSVDGGYSWDRVMFGLSEHARAVAFATRKIGVVSVGDAIARTIDGGVEWEEVEVDIPGRIYAIAFATPDYGLAVGEAVSFGSALETTDGGLTWKRIATPTLQTLTGATCFAPFDAIVSGPDLLALEYNGATSKKRSSAPQPTSTPTEKALALLPNRPNPFNPSTTIRFAIPERALVRLSIYDVAGRHMTTLINEVREAGPHSVHWNGTDAGGGRVASGVYFSRLESGESCATRKMLLLK